jgi:HEXXH motif-containing protein
MSPKELLWADSETYQRRLEKSGIALIAIRRAFEANRQLVRGVNEFLRLYEILANADPVHFTQIWSDPGAYFWARRTVAFLAAARGEPLGTIERQYCTDVEVNDPLDALAHHLAEFKRFALALGVITGIEVSFSEPYEASLPLAIPATPMVIAGNPRASIAGVRAGVIAFANPHLKLDVSGEQKPEGLRIESCPTITLDDVSLYLNPATFRWPGLGIATGWTALPLAFQFEHAGLAREALAAVRRYQPWTFSHLAAGLHTIGLKPNDADFINVTASELPGAFVCSVPADPYLLASSFIHEFHHNTLFGIEEQHGAFFEASGEDEIEGENHYSPWVETLRPLHGILHAVYVFLPVFRFWCAILDENSLDENQLIFAREQVARIPAQLRMGVNQLRRHARLTAVGAMLLDAMESETAAASEHARVVGATLKAPVVGITPSGALRPLKRGGRYVTVAETLLEHLEASDTLGECAVEKAEIAIASR